MYMKNFGSTPVTKVEYEGLKKDGKFRFPHAVKYVAWFLLLACIIISSVILIYYGMSFGMIKTYLCMTAIFGTLLQGILLISPIRIIIISFIKGVCLKLKVQLIKRPIPLTLLSNPYQPLKKKQALNFRKYNAHLYKPVSLHKLQTRTEEAKYNLELRNLTVDVITHVFFMVTVFYVVLINKTDMGYVSTEVIENLVVKGSYTNSIPLTNITTYDTLIEYLNKTLLPALLVNYKDYKKVYLPSDKSKTMLMLGLAHRKYYIATPDIKINVFDKILEAYFKSKRMQRELSVRNEVSERQTLEDSNLFDDGRKTQSDFYQRGWTLEPAIKLIGKMRIRQVRVKADSCEQYEDIESRNVECAAELNLLNVETRNFTLRWDPWPSEGLTISEEEPWIYKSGWKTKTMPIFAKFSTYPWGGYVLNFGRSINDSRIVLDYLDSFQWIDAKTRGIFIEFTTYCVNMNVFNVVTLIAEKSATGYIIPSYKIETCGFLFLSAKLEVMSIVMIVLFSLLLFFFILRETIRMHRTSIWSYFKRTFGILNLAIIFFGVLSLVFIILRSTYVGNLLKKLELSDNNEFVSFTLAAYWHTVSIYIEAFLVCLASFKVFRLLIFRVIFFQLQTTLSHCCKQFVDLVLQILVLTMGFALFFYLCLNAYAYCFSNFAVSVSTMLGRSVLLDDTFDFSIFNSSPWYLAPVFFAIFVIVITILFMNLFIAVVCLYFSFIRKISLINKYSIPRYVKHVLTNDREGDLLRIKGENRFGKQNLKLLRLKGGGNIASRRMAPKQKVNRITKTRQKTDDKEEPVKTHRRDFVKEKQYEPIIFQSLPEVRALTMKYLMVAALTDNEDKRKIAKEKALQAYFATIISNGKCCEKNFSQDQYILVVKEHDKEAINRRRLLEIKKTVELYGEQKGWIAKEDIGDECYSAEGLKNNIDVFCKKVDDLLKIFQKR